MQASDRIFLKADQFYQWTRWLLLVCSVSMAGSCVLLFATSEILHRERKKLAALRGGDREDSVRASSTASLP